MKKALKKLDKNIYHYVDGQRIEGAHGKITGYVSYITGYVGGIYGNVSGISGYVSYITGYVGGIYGNLDDCELTDEERKKGVNIEDLIGE